jgi:Na+/phosphate symporter
MIEDIDNDGKNYQTSVYYMDIINAYEKMGDYMINVSQDLERGFMNR